MPLKKGDRVAFKPDSEYYRQGFRGGLVISTTETVRQWVARKQKETGLKILEVLLSDPAANDPYPVIIVDDCAHTRNLPMALEAIVDLSIVERIDPAAN
jgi:hypothetical protein